jgi:large subunit ribosomal protein L37Ae
MVKPVAAGKTFGTRYGRQNRDRYAALGNEARRKHKCPYCNYVQVKRLASSGIWECRKCTAKFTARAYTTKIAQVKLDNG